MNRTSKFPNFVLLVVLLFMFSNFVDKDKFVASVKAELVDLVYPVLDTENTRWFYFSSASLPFGMVILSPDNELNETWRSDYQYHIDTIQGFSHIHAWQMATVLVMPVIIPKELNMGSSKDINY